MKNLKTFFVVGVLLGCLFLHASDAGDRDPAMQWDIDRVHSMFIHMKSQMTKQGLHIASLTRDMKAIKRTISRVAGAFDRLEQARMEQEQNYAQMVAELQGQQERMSHIERALERLKMRVEGPDGSRLLALERIEKALVKLSALEVFLQTAYSQGNARR